MRSINTEQELILTINNNKNFNNLIKFLESLSLSAENDGARDIIINQKKYGEETLEFTFNIETDNKEKLIIVLGEKRTHIFLKKGKKFEQLKEKFFKFINY